jgi:DNA-binding HxlR family transcriptional regulator
MRQLEDSMVHDVESPACRSVNEILQRIGDKWSMLIVSKLSDGSRRFNELRRDIPTISQRMLTLSLRGLERDGLVTRTVTPSIPPRVDYALTPLGESLQGPICALAAWAIDNIDSIHAAQSVYDIACDAKREAA